MTTETQEVINKLTELGIDGTQRIIEGYTRWYLTSAICWFLFGFVILFAAKKLYQHKTIDEGSDWDFDPTIAKTICVCIMVFLGFWMIAFNLSTILSPEAYAIHNLLGEFIK